MMKMTVSIGRTIPHPQKQYSSIRGEIAIETTMDDDIPARIQVRELKHTVRTELARLLQEECARDWADVPDVSHP